MLFEEQTVALSHRVYPRARLNLLMERITKKPTKTVGKTWKSKETIADNFNYFMLRYGLKQPSGVMIVERLGHMENSKPFGWYSNGSLCMIRSHGTKSHILVGKLRNRTFKTKAGPRGLVRVALFWKSHCATCSPAWVILYHLTRSCKRPIEISAKWLGFFPSTASLHYVLKRGKLSSVIINLVLVSNPVICFSFQPGFGAWQRRWLCQRIYHASLAGRRVQRTSLVSL